MPPAHPAAASHDDSAAGVYGRRVRSMSPGDPAGCGGAAAATPAGVFAATGAEPLSPGRPRGHSEELPRLSRQRSAPLTPLGGEGGAVADTPATAFHLSPAMAAAAAGESPAGLALAPPFLAPTLVSRHSSAPTQLVAGAGAPLPAIDPLAAPIDEILRDLCFSGQIGCYLLLPDTSGGVAHDGYDGGEEARELPELPFGLFVQDWQEEQRAQHEADMREKRSFRETPP